MTQLSIGVLKTQNQALVSRLNLLKSKLKAAETDAEGRLPQQINCSLAVEMFSNRMSQVNSDNSSCISRFLSLRISSLSLPKVGLAYS